MTTNTYPPIRHFQLVRKTQYCLNYDVPVRFTRKLFHLEVFFCSLLFVIAYFASCTSRRSTTGAGARHRRSARKTSSEERISYLFAAGEAPRVVIRHSFLLLSRQSASIGGISTIMIISYKMCCSKIRFDNVM